MDSKLFIKGKASDAYNFFGNHSKEKGYIFRVFAKEAVKVEIIGDFNDWQGQNLRKYSSGVFSTTIKNAREDDRYQYIITSKNGVKTKKIDPFAQKVSLEENSSLVGGDSYKFNNKKTKKTPNNIYQVHLGSLLKDKEFTFDKLIDHCIKNNFDYISFMPLTEYKNYKSYGYKTSNFFAFSTRYKDSKEFKNFVDKAHAKNIGILAELDLYEFDESSYFLENFDGTSLYNYDYDDIKYNYYGAMNFDPSKNSSRSFLLSVVNFWLKEYNLDGIVLANIENAIYWQGQKDRGINKEWISLISKIIEIIHKNKALALASYNGICDLDFDLDYIYDLSFRQILRIMQKSPFERNNYRVNIQNLIINDTSKKILGFSFVDSFLDEASLAMKIYGNEKISQLKTLMTFLYSIDSSKMIFMGDELASFDTFSVFEKTTLDTTTNESKVFNKYFKSLTNLYKNENALSNKDSSSKLLDLEGYSIYGFIRECKNDKLLVLINFTDLEYKIKSPYNLEELINTEDLIYDGNGNINGKVNKNDFIKIMPFGSAIFRIK